MRVMFAVVCVCVCVSTPGLRCQWKLTLNWEFWKRGDTDTQGCVAGAHGSRDPSDTSESRGRQQGEACDRVAGSLQVDNPAAPGLQVCSPRENEFVV